MATRMTSTHCTSTTAWRFTTFTSTSTECTHARIVSPSLIIHTHIGSSSSLASTPLTVIIMAIHVVVVSLRLDFLLLPLHLPPVCLPRSEPTLPLGEMEFPAHCLASCGVRHPKYVHEDVCKRLAGNHTTQTPESERHSRCCRL